jgi:prepilin-type N-terminal cleavage/methylation domain-containing protein
MNACTANRSHAASRRDGFTLIELLIVIAILGLLAAALLPNILGASETQKLAETKARLQAVRAAVDAFERKFSFYPPADFNPLDDKVLPMKGKTDKTNAGIESLVIALHWKSFGGTTFEEQTSWLTNTDEDDYGVEIPLLGRSAKMEIADAWGNPIAYFHGDFETEQRVQLGLESGGAVVRVRAWQDPKTKRPLGARKGWQLVSAGPDRAFNTDDDLTWPERPNDG